MEDPGSGEPRCSFLVAFRLTCSRQSLACVFESCRFNSGLPTAPSASGLMSIPLIPDIADPIASNRASSPRPSKRREISASDASAIRFRVNARACSATSSCGACKWLKHFRETSVDCNADCSARLTVSGYPSLKCPLPSDGHSLRS